MKVLVVGGGGREHAIIKSVKKNEQVEVIYALPGNGGIAEDAVCVDIGAKDIEGIVENSVLASGVKVARGAYVKDSVIMKNVVIGEGTTVNYSIIDSDTIIGAGSVIGRTKGSDVQIALIGSDLEIKPGSDIPDGDMVNSEWLENHNANR